MLAVAIVVAVAALNRPTTPASGQAATDPSTTTSATATSGDQRPDGLRNNVVVDATHHLAYAASDAGVHVVNTTSSDPVAVIPAGTTQSALALDVASSRLYVAGPAGTMRVIDTATNRELAALKYDAQLSGVALDVTAARGYLADSDHNAILLIDLKDGRLIQTIQLTKGAPAGLTLIASRHLLYAISLFNDQVLVVDTRLRAEIGTIEVGRLPRAVAVDEQAGRAYVSQLVTPDSVAVIDVASGQVTATISLDDAGQGIAVDPRHACSTWLCSMVASPPTIWQRHVPARP